MPTNKEKPKFLRVSEVCKILNCSKSTICELMQKGKLPYYRITEKAVRIDEKDLINYLEERKCG